MHKPALPMTKNWTCMCGKTHSLRQRVCDQCRRPLPPEIRYQVYEEELAYQKHIARKGLFRFLSATYRSLEQKLPPGVLPIILLIIFALLILLTATWYLRAFGNLGDWLRQLCVLIL